MQISNILTSWKDSVLPGKTKESGESLSLPATLRESTGTTSSPQATKLIAETMRKYDVTNISLSDFSQMLRQLRQTGTLSEKDFSELSQIVTDLTKEGTSSEEKVNLLEICSDRLRKIQRMVEDGAGSEILGPELRRMEWLEKFSVLHNQPEGKGVDLMV